MSIGIILTAPILQWVVLITFLITIPKLIIGTISLVTLAALVILIIILVRITFHFPFYDILYAFLLDAYTITPIAAAHNNSHKYTLASSPVFTLFLTLPPAFPADTFPF